MVNKIIKTGVAEQTLRSHNGTPDLVQAVLALLKTILEPAEIACAGDNDVPDAIEANLAWPCDHGYVQGGRLTLKLETLDAEEFAADKAAREANFAKSQAA